MNHRIDTEPQLVKVREQKLLPCPEGTTYSIKGKEYPVKGYYENGGQLVPLVDIKMQSDYKWQYDCLMDRLEHPEKYTVLGEDVQATIERLKQWLIENRHKARAGDLIYIPEKATA